MKVNDKHMMLIALFCIEEWWRKHEFLIKNMFVDFLTVITIPFYEKYFCFMGKQV